MGFENHSGKTYLGAGCQPLGHSQVGAGNNGEDGTEGAIYRDVYACYLHGSLLPKNPWFADHLLQQALPAATAPTSRWRRWTTAWRSPRSIPCSSACAVRPAALGVQ